MNQDEDSVSAILSSDFRLISAGDKFAILHYRTVNWTDPTLVDKFCPHDEACSKASGLTPPR